MIMLKVECNEKAIIMNKLSLSGIVIIERLKKNTVSDSWSVILILYIVLEGHGNDEIFLNGYYTEWDIFLPLEL